MQPDYGRKKDWGVFRMPSGQYALARRGAPEVTARYGFNKRVASSAQLAARKNEEFVGQGRYSRKRKYFRGKGGFFSDAGNWLKGAGGWVGDRMGTISSTAKNLAEGNWGAAARSGYRLGSQLLGGSGVGAYKMRGQGMYTGHGAYSNSLIDPDPSDDRIASFTSANDETGAITVTHKEYICDLYGPPTTPGVVNQIGTFVNQSYQINPALEATFPWLSQIAANYDEYKMNQLIFTYRSTVSDFATNNGQVGTVIMATQYNAAAIPFQDKESMLQYDASESGKTTANMLHGVECDESKLKTGNGGYTRSNPVVIGQDIKTYDHGQFNIAFANIPTNLLDQSLGELWVSYSVTLSKPKIFTGRGYAIARDYFVNPTDTAYTPQLSPPMGTPINLLKGQQNSIGCLVISKTIFAPLPGGVVPVAYNAINDVIFPAGYTGNVKLIYTVCSRPGTGFFSNYQNQIPGQPAGTFYTEEWLISPPTQSENCFGNVTLIKDIYGASNQQNTQPDVARNAVSNMFNVPGLFSPTHVHQMFFIVHLAIGVANSGQDNIFRFGNVPQIAGAYPITNYCSPVIQSIQCCSLDIQEYNTFSTNNSLPVLINPQGGVVFLG